MLETSFRIVKGSRDEGMLQGAAERAVEAYAGRAERSGKLCEVSFDTCKLGLTLALARSPVGPRQRAWCTLSVVDINNPDDDDDAVCPTDELVRMNGKVVAIRDDDEFDDLDRILAFDELKETIKEAERPIRLTFVRTEGRRRKDATRALVERHEMSLHDKPIIIAKIKVQGEKLRHLVDQLGTTSEADAATARAVSRMARARAITARKTYRHQLVPKQFLLEARATDAYVTARRAFVTSAVLAVLEQAEFERIANMMTLDNETLDEISRMERLLEAGHPKTSSSPPEISHVSPPPIFENDHHRPAKEDEKGMTVSTQCSVDDKPNEEEKRALPLSQNGEDDEFDSSGEEKIMVSATANRSIQATTTTLPTKKPRDDKKRTIRRRKRMVLPPESSNSSTNIEDVELQGDAAELRRVRATRKLVREVSMEASVAAMRAELLVSRLSSEEAQLVSPGSGVRRERRRIRSRRG